MYTQRSVPSDLRGSQSVVARFNLQGVGQSDAEVITSDPPANKLLCTCSRVYLKCNL